MTIFFISDTHFTHANMLVFTGPDHVTPMRQFDSVEAMDEFMVENWNRVVRPSDHIYHLGDVAMRQSALPIVKRLNGKKRLIRGNHDIYKTKKYLDVGFEEILSCRYLGDMMFTHFPIHPTSLGRYRANVHGHTHANPSPPGRYLNICVEQTNYTPLSLEVIQAEVALREQVYAPWGEPVTPRRSGEAEDANESVHEE